MKDSKKYATKIKKLFKELKKKYSPGKDPDYKDPIESVVYAVVSEYSSLSSAKSAVKKIKTHFVDYNDLRVSRPEEIVDVLDTDNDSGIKIAEGLTVVLNAVFNRYDIASLVSCYEVGKRQARKELAELKCFSDFVLGYCFLTALKGHSIPLTEPMVAYLHDNGLVYPSAKASVIEGFLERQISTTDGYAFYMVLRQESEKEWKKTSKIRAKAAAAEKKAAEKKEAAVRKKADAKAKAVAKKEETAKEKAAAKNKVVTKKKAAVKKKAVTKKKTVAKKKITKKKTAGKKAVSKKKK